MIRTMLITLAASLLLACGGGDPLEPTSGNPIAMNYGFQVFDSANRILIDERASALHYIGQATYAGVDPANSNYLLFDITSPGGGPMPFVEVTPGAGHVVSIAAIWNTALDTWRVSILTSQGPTTKVHCFAALGTLDNAMSSYGLQVFDAAGNKGYDSTRSPLGIREIVTFPAGSGTVTSGAATDAGTQTASATLSGSRVAIFAAAAFRVVSTSQATNAPPGQSFGGIIRVDAGALVRKAGPVLASSGPSAGPYYWSSAGESILILDMAPYL